MKLAGWLLISPTRIQKHFNTGLFFNPLRDHGHGNEARDYKHSKAAYLPK
jgi:hypothetical protein